MSTSLMQGARPLVPWLLLAALLAGCAHTAVAVPPRPTSNVPRDERERYFQMYRKVEAPETTALRWCADTWNCCWPACGVCQDLAFECNPLRLVCSPFGLSSVWSPPIVLGSGARVRDPGELAALVEGTPAGDTYVTYQAAVDAQSWLIVSAIGTFFGAVALSALTYAVASGVDGTGGTLLGFTGFGVVGLLLVGTVGSVIGIPISHGVAFFSRQLFFEQYNASLRQALGLDRSGHASQ
jgi:hypothetical protein